jgi:hypothetical protein
MAREPRPPRPKLDRPGQRPLLQGHLRRGGQRATDAGPQDAPETPGKPATEPASAAIETADATDDTAAGPPAQPASEVAKGRADVLRGKATRSPAEVATRKHLEGPEQGPM